MRELLRRLEEARRMPAKAASEQWPVPAMDDGVQELVALLVREGAPADEAAAFADDLLRGISLKPTKVRTAFRVTEWSDVERGRDYERSSRTFSIWITVRVPEKVTIVVAAPLVYEDSGTQVVARRYPRLAGWLRDQRVRKIMEEHAMDAVVGETMWWEGELDQQLQDYVESAATYDTQTRIYDRETGEESTPTETLAPQLDFSVAVDSRPRHEVRGGEIVRTYVCRGALKRILWPGDYGYER